jgi:hypothetical protein
VQVQTWKYAMSAVNESIHAAVEADADFDPVIFAFLQ